MKWDNNNNNNNNNNYYYYYYLILLKLTYIHDQMGITNITKRKLYVSVIKINENESKIYVHLNRVKCT